MTIYHGDCIDVLKTLPDCSVDAVVTDPPYGLSEGVSTQSISQRIYDAIVKIGFPNLYEWDAKIAQGLHFASVSGNGTDLRSEDRPIGERTRIGVPEGSVYLQDNFVGKKEVGNGDKAPGVGITNGILSDETDAQPSQFMGDFILKLGDMGTNGISGDVSDSCLAEAFFGGFTVPIFTPCSPSIPGGDTGSVTIVFGDQDVWFSNNASGDSQTSPFVMTLPRAVNALMLRFDLSGRPIELLATHRADHLTTVGKFGGAELVRARSTTRSLASVAQPHRIRFIVPTADGACALYWFHLWCPFQSITKSIIPRGGFMGKQWDATLPSSEIWRECLRVLKPGGHLLAFAGTRTQHRMAVAIEDAGFEIRDMIMWVYGQGFPKSHDVSKAIDNAAGAEREVVGKGASGKTAIWAEGGMGNFNITAPATDAAKQWQGWGTALKPALEPITVARKPLVGTVAENVLEHGTGAINVDGCRVGTDGGTAKANIRKGEPNGDRAGTSMGENISFRCDIATINAGRWPANLIHDGSEEVVGLFPETTSGITPRRGWHNGREASRCKGAEYGHETLTNYGDTGSAARFFYCAKASKRDRDEGCEGLALGEPPASARSKPAEGRQNALGEPRRNHHPTVKPTDLMRYLVRLVTPPGGVVLDPFMGSGSTGKACALEGLNFIGIEREEEYVEIARARIAAVSPEPVASVAPTRHAPAPKPAPAGQLSLFDEVQT